MNTDHAQCKCTLNQRDAPKGSDVHFCWEPHKVFYPPSPTCQYFSSLAFIIYAAVGTQPERHLQLHLRMEETQGFPPSGLQTEPWSAWPQLSPPAFRLVIKFTYKTYLSRSISSALYGSLGSLSSSSLGNAFCRRRKETISSRTVA